VSVALTKLKYFSVATCAAVLLTQAHSTNIQNGGLAAKILYPFSGNVAATVAVDSGGFIYPAGKNFDGLDGTTAIFQRYSSLGQQMYLSGLPGTTNSISEIDYSTTDASGNLYLLGKQVGDGTGYDWILVKETAATGNLLWARHFNGSANADDIPCGLAVDSSGNVYVAGTVDYTALQTSNMAVAKYNSAGVLIWDNLTLVGAGATAKAMCLTPDGHVYVAGASASGEFAIGAVDPTGSTQPGLVVGPDFGQATSISSDANNNVIVTGYSGNFPANKYAQIIYMTNGTMAWGALFSTPNSDVEGNTAKFDPSGNVLICTDTTVGSSVTKLDTLKYDKTGVKKWQATFKGLSTAVDQIKPGGMVLDKYGDVYLSGCSYYSSAFPKAGYFVKYNSSGTQMFTLYHGIANTDEVPTMATIDANSDVYAAGYTHSILEGYATMVLRWTQAPICNSDAYSVVHSTSLTVNAPGLMGNDTFTTGATVTVHTAPTHGTLVLNANGTFKYTPTSGYIGTDTFQYTAQKAVGGGLSNVATVTITVT
jgi:hypothetical protein